VPSRGFSRASAGGFTLIELLVALTIGGVVVLLAHRVFTGVADGAARVGEVRTALDREQNARRLLTELVGSLDVGRPGTDGFDGDPDRVAFSTWVLGVHGWPEPCRVSLSRYGAAFVVGGVSDAPLALADSVRSLAFDYLLDYGAAAAWVRAWKSPVSAPLAMRIRIERAGSVDTLLLVVGPRG
jgi:prepilin-type N-terminal cleavage/methylation domain-containing protein